MTFWKITQAVSDRAGKIAPLALPLTPFPVGSCNACELHHPVPTRPESGLWLVLRIQKISLLVLLQRFFRKSYFLPLSGHCLHYWGCFCMEMKLFSVADLFQWLRFTLICETWQEINSFFFMCFMAEKILLQKTWDFCCFCLFSVCLLMWSAYQNRSEVWTWPCVYTSVWKWPLEQRWLCFLAKDRDKKYI